MRIEVKRKQDEVLVQRQEDEEYIIVCLKVRQGLVEDSWIGVTFLVWKKGETIMAAV